MYPDLTFDITYGMIVQTGFCNFRHSAAFTRAILSMTESALNP
jgi:hypothetical protein